MKNIRFLFLLFLLQANFLAIAQGYEFHIISEEDIIADTFAFKDVIEDTITFEDIHMDCYFPSIQPKFLRRSVTIESFLKKNIIYPTSAIKDSISGKVTLSFTIDKNGKASNINIVKGIREDLDSEAIRVLRLIEWKPNDNPTHEKTILSLKFILSKMLEPSE